MIHRIIQAAHRLDLWLQSRLGRPYNALLGVGLTIEVVRRLVELPAHLSEWSHVGGAALLIAMNAALLVHQVGELSHRWRPRGAQAPHGGGEPTPTSEAGEDRRGGRGRPVG